MSDIPEIVRAKIDKMFSDAMVGMPNNPMNDTFQHMMVQICTEMYKIGFNDALRSVTINVASIQEAMKR